MKYWMIKDGNSEGPFSLEELTAHGLAAETKVWRQGLSQWTEARHVPEFAQIFGVKVEERRRTADDAVRHCPTHLRAAVVTTVIIALSFFNLFAPLSLLGSPFFYLLLPLRGCRYAQPLLHAACCAPATLRRQKGAPTAPCFSSRSTQWWPSPYFRSTSWRRYSGKQVI